MFEGKFRAIVTRKGNTNQETPDTKYCPIPGSYFCLTNLTLLEPLLKNHRRANLRIRDYREALSENISSSIVQQFLLTFWS